MASATRQFYIYLHCKPDGTPFYVGKGHGIRSHDFGRSSDRNQHHINVVAKYGRKNIGIFIFPCGSEREAFDDEKRTILQLREDGYKLTNKTDGGEGVCGLQHTPEAKAKIGAASKGNRHNLGRKHTLETKAKLSIVRRGNKNSLGHLGLLGTTRSAETRARISASLRGKPWTVVRWAAQQGGRHG